jgi:hypothetical protein
LLRGFLAAPFGRRKLLAAVPHFDFEHLLMIGSGLVVNPVFDRTQPPLLEPFLKRRFVVRVTEPVHLIGQNRIEK